MKRTNELINAGRLAIIGVATLAVVASSCRKKKDQPPQQDTDTSVVSEDARLQAENSFLGSVLIWEWQTDTNLRASTGGVIPGCATVTVEVLDTVRRWPRRVKIDFGTTNCLCLDGKWRRGVIYITYPSPWAQRQPGDTVIIQPSNYYVNDNKVEGTWYVSVKDSVTLRIDVVGAKVTFTDGTYHSWECHRERQFYAGYTTPYNHTDDVYLISVLSCNGTTRHGTPYSVITTSGQPLRVELSCKWITAGELQITPQGKPTRVVNFGSGTCDSLATVSVGSWSTTIVLP